MVLLTKIIFSHEVLFWRVSSANSLDNRRRRMKQISNKEYEKYQRYQADKLRGRILTPDGLRVICAGLDNDPERIGIHMLEMLSTFRREGLFDVAVEDE